MNEEKIGLILRYGIFLIATLCAISLLLSFLPETDHWKAIYATKLIRFSLGLLIGLQLLRVALTIWVFKVRKEWVTVGCSVFILLSLCLGLFDHGGSL
jgi:uncharacterized membrane protein